MVAATARVVAVQGAAATGVGGGISHGVEPSRPCGAQQPLVACCFLDSGLDLGLSNGGLQRSLLQVVDAV